MDARAIELRHGPRAFSTFAVGHVGKHLAVLLPADGSGQQSARRSLCLKRRCRALATLIAHHRPKSLNGASLKEALQTDQRQPARLSAMFQSWRASPGRMYEASPTMVFAVIGQARAEGYHSRRLRAESFPEMLNYWALRDTLDTAVYCAKPALIRSAAPSLFFDTN